ncbi:MAG: ATP-binding protein [Aquificota bacterium]|nr:ATP-binding protein [Aquificota bacterium]
MVCERCGGTGFVSRGDGRVDLCECRFSKEDLNRVLGIPKRFWDKDLDNYIPETEEEQDALFQAKVFAETFGEEEGFSITFVGPPGVGKTHLAVGILKKVYREKNIKGFFFDTKDLIYRLKLLMEERKTGRAIRRILDLPLIVLDDLGSERLSDWQREIMAYIISYRYNNLKSTVITTNFPLEERQGKTHGLRLSERIDPGTVSRIYGMGKVVYIKGKDRRRIGELKLWDEGNRRSG